MAHNEHSNTDPQHHITPKSVYFAVFAALMVFTVITVLAALQDFGALNTPIALTIATIKATLVILYFMHVRHSTRLTWLVIIASFVMMGVLFVLTFSDYLSREMSHL